MAVNQKKISCGLKFFLSDINYLLVYEIDISKKKICPLILFLVKY